MKSPQHETSDASTRAVLAGGAIFVAGIGISLFIAYLAMRPINVASRAEETFEHGPAEERPMQRDWVAVQNEARAHLTGYAWIDRNHGQVRIPVTRAMEIVAEQAAEAEGKHP